MKKFYSKIMAILIVTVVIITSISNDAGSQCKIYGLEEYRIIDEVKTHG